VERIGVQRAREALEEAELVLALTDAADGDTEAETLIRSLSEQGRTVIRIFTKSDLNTPNELPADGVPTVALSSLTGEGFDALTEAVEAAFIDRDLRMGEEAVVFSARQVAALRETAAYLHTALENLDAGLPYDICAGDVRAAMGELGLLCGRELREEVLDEIFSRFCVGK
jgi:tRNA modification GTPase